MLKNNTNNKSVLKNIIKRNNFQQRKIILHDKVSFRLFFDHETLNA